MVRGIVFEVLFFGVLFLSIVTSRPTNRALACLPYQTPISIGGWAYIGYTASRPVGTRTDADTANLLKQVGSHDPHCNRALAGLPYQTPILIGGCAGRDQRSVSLGFVCLNLLGVAAMVVRFRRSVGDERLQTKIRV